MDLVPGQRVGDYTVDALLGRGGMATVYRVHDAAGQAWALKVLDLPVAALRERFVREGTVQREVVHPNVVQVHDVVEDALVLELVEGPSLADFLEQGAPSAAEVEAIGAGILAGVAAAHAAGLVHRDLKPANILLAVDGDVVVPKVADFGLAKLLDTEGGPTPTRTGAVLGTPNYMAPEQIADSKNVDARADVFALGALLFELATGRRAFPGDDMLDVFDKVRAGAPPLPALPARVRATLEAALRSDPQTRPADATALLAMWTAPETHLRPALWLVAGVVSVPLLLVVLVGLFGSLDAAGDAGIFLYALLIAAGLGSVALTALADDSRRGGSRATAPWLIFPALTVALGSLGTSMGCAVMFQAIDHAGATTKALLATNGMGVAMMTDLIGAAFASLLLLGAALAGAWTSTAPSRPWTPTLASIGIGCALWAAAAATGTAVPSLAVLVVLVVAAICCREGAGARVATCSILAVGAAAFAVRVHVELWRFRTGVRTFSDDPLATADLFTAMVEAPGVPVVAWVVAIAFAAAPLFRGASVRDLAGVSAVLLPLVAVGWVDRAQLGAARSRVVPALYAVAAADGLGIGITDARLRAAEVQGYTLDMGTLEVTADALSTVPIDWQDGVLVTDPGQSALADRDVIVAIDDVPVRGARGLLDALSVREPGDVELTVLRGPDAERRLHRVTVQAKP